MVNYLKILWKSIVFSIIAILPIIFVSFVFWFLGVFKFNGTSEFPFGALAALIAALIVIPFHFELQRKKMVANQIVKSRIDWLQSMKKYTANYLNSVDNYVNGQNRPLGYEYCKHRDKDEKSSQELKNIADKNYYLLMFNLNPDEKITKKIRKYHSIFVEEICNCKECYPQKRSKITATIQKYFKREWDKAKSEIKSGDIAVKDNR